MQPSDRSRKSDEPAGRLSIGALARATGIPVETLRTWEARYGFPVPERKPSGHRVYPVSSVPRLRRISEALSRGLRAGDVVPATEREISSLLAAMPAFGAAGAAPRAATAMGTSDVESLLADIERFDAEKLTWRLLGQHARSTPIEFLEEHLGPLVRGLGDAWEAGRLDIRHEHFASERIGEILRSLRQPLESRAVGPLVVYATLPRETHGLGLQMAALVLGLEGCRSLFLGTEVPPAELAALAGEVDARAVAISVSEASRGPRTQAAMRRLRRALPRRVAIVAGGAGARPAAGIDVVGDFAALAEWGAKLSAGAGML